MKNKYRSKRLMEDAFEQMKRCFGGLFDSEQVWLDRAEDLSIMVCSVDYEAAYAGAQFVRECYGYEIVNLRGRNGIYYAFDFS